MKVAKWNGTVIAETDEWEEVEGNIYFPRPTVDMTKLQESEKTTTCPWKGNASYYNVVVNSDTNKNAAWTYREPKDAAKEIKGYIAFWRGVTVEDKA